MSSQIVHTQSFQIQSSYGWGNNFILPKIYLNTNSNLIISENKKKSFKKVWNNSTFIYKKKFPPTNYKCRTFYRNKYSCGNLFNNFSINNNYNIYNNNNFRTQDIVDSPKEKYIIETVKEEIFIKPENFIIFNNENLNQIKINKWNENICCSCTESLCCLGNDDSNNINQYIPQFDDFME